MVLADGATVILAQIGAVEPFDPAAADSAPVVEAIEQQFDDQAADDVLTSFVAAIRDGAGVSVNQALRRVDARALPVMQLFPAFDDFAADFDAGRNQVIWTRLVADLDTPVVADAEADRGAQGQLPARERHRRRGARPLLDHGDEARPDLGVPRHRRPGQPLGPLRPRGLDRRPTPTR